MRKSLFCIGLIACVMLLGVSASAATSLKAHTFKEGIKDMVTSPARIIETTQKQVKETEGGGIFRGQAVGFTAGVMEGSAAMISQFLKGLVKVVTSPVQ